MAKQNIYDNETFFDAFKEIRANEVNYNDCIETPILLSMLPELYNKRVLDIGCGMGQHAKQYADMGASSVLGIDISDKMLQYAREHNAAENITYRQMAMEDISGIDSRFQVITSSLVFDYIEDFDLLMQDVYRLLEEEGLLVFSMSHPMTTAWDGKYDRFTRDDDGVPRYANIGNYMQQGHREITWVVEGYELYHRTISSLVNSIVKAGFVIEECQESYISDEMIAKFPKRFGGTVHRPDFIFFRCRKMKIRMINER